MKRETEATSMAAHDQAITTNAVKVKIHKQQGSLCAGCARKKRNRLHMYSVSALSSHKLSKRADTIKYDKVT